MTSLLFPWISRRPIYDSKVPINLDEPMTIAIVDYRAGNLTSVQRALASIGKDAVITDDFATITTAKRVIFPGVGAAKSCMQALQETGVDQALRTVHQADTPLLGICVGMQLMFQHSEEDGGVDCLGFIPGRVRRFQPDDPSLKVPHMGWNPITHNADPLMKDIVQDTAMYFVHSYYCDPEAEVSQLCSSNHDITFCSGIRQNNTWAVQFHPEKSGPEGLKLLRNFCNL